MLCIYLLSPLQNKTQCITTIIISWQQEEPFTLAGVGQPAQISKELGLSMPGELGRLITAVKGEHPIISACQTILTIASSTADNLNHTGRVTYECVDKDPESIPGLDDNGHAAGELVAYFQLVEAVCDGLPCSESEYDPEKELTCVVCTR